MNIVHFPYPQYQLKCKTAEHVFLQNRTDSKSLLPALRFDQDKLFFVQNIDEVSICKLTGYPSYHDDSSRLSMQKLKTFSFLTTQHQLFDWFGNDAVSKFAFGIYSKHEWNDLLWIDDVLSIPFSYQTFLYLLFNRLFGYILGSLPKMDFSKLWTKIRNWRIFSQES